MSSTRSIMKFLVAGLLLSASVFAYSHEMDSDKPVTTYGNMEIPAPVSVPAGKTAENVKETILKALPLHGWAGTEIAPDVIEARFDKNGKHTLIVDLKYDAAAVAMTYKSSVNLKYEVVDNQQKLHRKANSWMKNLSQDIAAGLAR